MTNLSTAIAAIMELDEKRTQGEWDSWMHSNPSYVVNINGSEFDSICTTAHGNDKNNAAFIAQAPHMVAIIRKQAAMIEELRECMSGAIRYLNAMSEIDENPDASADRIISEEITRIIDRTNPLTVSVE